MTAERTRRRSVGALALSCVAAAVLSACAPGADSDGVAPRSSTWEPALGTEPALDAASMQTIADHLRRTAPCDRADVLHDDLAFWDSMRGFDCLDPDAPTFIRVYAHAVSVPQTLAEWDGTFDSDRAVVRGANWYVIGPPSTVSGVEAPTGAPRVADDVGEPVSLTPEQDYTTTCMLFVSNEGPRYVRWPDERSTSAQQYDEVFPGVTDDVHAAIEELGRGRVLAVADEERWVAALSPIGPRLKKRCAAAYRAVGDAVQPLDGSER